MLSTHRSCGGELIASILNKHDDVRKRVYFIPPDDLSDSESSESDDEDDFRIPMRKKPKVDTTEIVCEKGYHMVPFYNPGERITMFIAGAQNCGKSYFVADFVRTYKRIHPKRPIYLLTGLSEKDKHFDRLGLRKIKMDSSIIGGLELEKLRINDETGKRTGCLLIFDDTDRIRDKGLMTKTYKLLDDALANGRDHATQDGKADIDVLVTNHEVNDYSRTRGVLTNCTYVVIFPYYSLARQMNLVMEKIGISKETQKKILGYKGRAVIIRKVAPMYGVMRNKIFLLRD